MDNDIGYFTKPFSGMSQVILIPISHKNRSDLESQEPLRKDDRES